MENTARHLRPRLFSLFVDPQPVDATTGSKGIDSFSVSGKGTARKEAGKRREKRGKHMLGGQNTTKESPRCIRRGREKKEEGAPTNETSVFFYLVVLLMSEATRPKPLLRPRLCCRSESKRKQGRERHALLVAERGLVANIDGVFFFSERCQRRRRQFRDVVSFFLLPRSSRFLFSLHSSLEKRATRETRHRKKRRNTTHVSDPA